MSASPSLAAPPSPFERFRRAVNRPWVALVAVGVIATTLRFTHVTYPEQRIFDEYYYSKSACIFLGYPNERCDVNSDDEREWRRLSGDVGSWVHPPLGKWAIAVGELIFGPDPFGWRFSAVVFGSASVVMLAGIAQLLFRKPIWTFTAGLLLATESLHFVQSRMAMLDIFVTTWVVAGFLFLVLDRRWIDRRTFGSDRAVWPAESGTPGPYPRPASEAPEEHATVEPRDGDSGGDAGGPPASLPPAPLPPAVRPSVPEPLFRPWRLLAGVAFGASVASKWSGVTAIATAVLLSLMWETSRRRRAGVDKPLWGAVAAEGFGIVISLLLVPAAVYVVSYAGWFVENGWSVRAWLRLQDGIADYHRDLDVVDAKGEPIHPYLSEAWKWILLVRPILYYSSYPVEGLRKVIYANGNPAVFWGGLLAVPFAVVRWRQRRDWRAGFVAVTVLGLYVPWMLVPRPQFLFYATPIVPFLVLACVYALQDVAEIRVAGSRSRPYLPFAIGFVVLSVGLFVWFWPALTGGPLSDAAFRLRAWFPTWT